MLLPTTKFVTKDKVCHKIKRQDLSSTTNFVFWETVVRNNLCRRRQTLLSATQIVQNDTFSRFRWTQVLYTKIYIWERNENWCLECNKYPHILETWTTLWYEAGYIGLRGNSSNRVFHFGRDSAFIASPGTLLEVDGVEITSLRRFFRRLHSVTIVQVYSHFTHSSKFNGICHRRF